jgi:DNA/RNA endonuclease G (NUC1)
MGIAIYGSMVFSSMKQIRYGEYQTLYVTVEGIEFRQGLQDLDNLDPREKH